MRASRHRVVLNALVIFAVILAQPLPLVLHLLGHGAHAWCAIASAACCVAYMGYVGWLRGSTYVPLWALLGVLGVGGLMLLGLVLILRSWALEFREYVRRSRSSAPGPHIRS